ncbi:MAG: hypothetical protein IIY23_00290 [Erysipelotrichaceae bacterium]|nr:hypothetical protein [Erysipelotrichaceae bacterium]
MKRMELRDFSFDDLKEEPEMLNAVYLCEGKEDRYALLRVEDYELLVQAYYEAAVNDPLSFSKPAEIRIIPQGIIELDEDEYEDLKQQVLDALEKTLKPKRKLN